MAFPFASTLGGLLDASPMGVVLHDAAGRIMHANPAFATLVGYRAEDVQLLNLFELIHADDRVIGHRGSVEWAPDLPPVFSPVAGLSDQVSQSTGHQGGRGSIPVRTLTPPFALTTANNRPPRSWAGEVSRRRLMHRSGQLVRCRTTSSTVLDGGWEVVLTLVQDLGTQELTVAEWRHAATHDPLTGLLNRAGMSDHLDQLVGARQTVELAMIDLDGLKLVNDTLGHPAGDRLLIAVAHFLTVGLPPGSVICRWAGDEFVVTGPPIAAGTPGPLSPVPSLADAIRQSLRAEIQVGPGTTLAIRASVGVATCGPQRPPAEAVAAADAAMYAMKQAHARAADTVPAPRRPWPARP